MNLLSSDSPLFLEPSSLLNLIPAVSSIPEPGLDSSIIHGGCVAAGPDEIDSSVALSGVA